MNIQEAIEILEKHQAWRRDSSVPPQTDMQDPAKIGKALGLLLAEVKNSRLNAVSSSIQKENKRYCKGCIKDVTNTMFCECGEMPLHINETYSEEEASEM